MLPLKVKKELLNICKAFVNKRVQNVQEVISSNQNALQSETKSSAGDKHETGRAMLQLEMEKAGQQLAGISKMKTTLAKIDLAKESKVAHLGSVIETKSATYFLAISIGKITVYNRDYFAVSIASPIGKLLLGKKQGEEFVFNGVKTKICNVF